MSAYVVIRVKVSEPSLLKDYQKVAPAAIEKYDGKLIVRGGELSTLEGPEEKRRIVIIEFPSLDKAKEFYNSKEYKEAIELRKGLAEFEVVAIEGIQS